MTDVIKVVVNTCFRLFLALFALCLFSASVCLAVSLKQSQIPIFIAHAGGAVNQQTYTNSLEALNLNYDNGFRFFEIDLSWTSDGELVAIHDWDGSFRGKFIVSEEIKVPTEAEFLKLKMKTGLTPLSLENVLMWAKGKGDVVIVTDIKDENIKALGKIFTDFEAYIDYIIPQVYSYQEYSEANTLGYPRTILTMYKMKIDPDEVMHFLTQNSPFAVTMPWQVAQSGLASHLYQNQIVVYAHTVNDIKLFNSLRKIGVFGIYTDYISPP
ncbi:MAG: glycerophosphodiester phosphodiesterase family protein [Desulfuromusa sp.]|nr:glycerophosphodiester phosphodiesterase family protein [Desulfuromusa sp.]